MKDYFNSIVTLTSKYVGIVMLVLLMGIVVGCSDDPIELGDGTEEIDGSLIPGDRNFRPAFKKDNVEPLSVRYTVHFEEDDEVIIIYSSQFQFLDSYADTLMIINRPEKYKNGPHYDDVDVLITRPTYIYHPFEKNSLNANFWRIERLKKGEDFPSSLKKRYQQDFGQTLVWDLDLDRDYNDFIMKAFISKDKKDPTKHEMILVPMCLGLPRTWKLGLECDIEYCIPGKGKELYHCDITDDIRRDFFNNEEGFEQVGENGEIGTIFTPNYLTHNARGVIDDMGWDGPTEYPSHHPYRKIGHVRGNEYAFPLIRFDAKEPGYISGIRWRIVTDFLTGTQYKVEALSAGITPHDGDGGVAGSRHVDNYLWGYERVRENDVKYIDKLYQHVGESWVDKPRANKEYPSTAYKRFYFLFENDTYPGEGVHISEIYPDFFNFYNNIENYDADYTARVNGFKPASKTLIQYEDQYAAPLDNTERLFTGKDGKQYVKFSAWCGDDKFYLYYSNIIVDVSHGSQYNTKMQNVCDKDRDDNMFLNHRYFLTSSPWCDKCQKQEIGKRFVLSKSYSYEGK